MLGNFERYPNKYLDLLNRCNYVQDVIANVFEAVIKLLTIFFGD